MHIAHSKIQTFKDRVDNIPKGLPLSKDLVDDLLIVKGYRLKMVSTYWPYYCTNLRCNNKTPLTFMKQVLVI